MATLPYACATCTKTSCFRGDLEGMPKTCPTRTDADVATDASPYRDEARAAVMHAADATPFSEDGSKRNRVEELVHFAQARELVCCRVGAIDYAEIGLPKAHPDRFAAICNPVAQARLLNRRRVDLVAQVGLCIGHDLILQQHCDAPVTTLVVKDRVFDHHPIMALRRRPPA
jgi:uncharacterized metal-binding protein